MNSYSDVAPHRTEEARSFVKSIESVNNRQKVELLNAQSKKLFRSDPVVAFSYSSKAFQLAVEIGDCKRKVESLIQMASAKYALSDYLPALEYVAQATNVLQSVHEPELELAAMHKASVLEYELGNYRKALKNSSFVYSCAERSENWDLMLDSLAILIGIHTQMCQYAKALGCAFDYLKLIQRSGRRDKEAIGYLAIGIIYSSIGSTDLAVSYFDHAETCFDEDKDPAGKAGFLFHYAKLKFALHQYDEAEESVKTSLRLYFEIGEKLGDTRGRTLFAKLLKAHGETQLAFETIERALQMAESMHHRLAMLDARLTLAEFQAQESRFEAALESYRSALTLSEELHSLRERVCILEGMAACYRALNELPIALDHYTAFLNTKLELLERERGENVKRIEIREALEQREREAEELRNKAVELRRELELRDSELSTLSLHLVEKKRFLSDLKETLTSAETLKLSETILRGKLLRQITKEHDEKTEALPTDQQFIHTHKTFMLQLSEQYPTLTPTELKVCALLKMNLSTKRIAQTMHISIYTVDTHRKRIRQKLGVSSNTNLSWFFAKI